MPHRSSVSGTAAFTKRLGCIRSLGGSDLSAAVVLTGPPPAEEQAVQGNASSATPHRTQPLYFNVCFSYQ